MPTPTQNPVATTFLTRTGTVMGREGAVAAAKRRAGLQDPSRAALDVEAPRLLLVDAQADPDGTLASAARPEVTVVQFDSTTEPLAAVAAAVAAARAGRGAAFRSIAVANHGVGADGTWQWGSDAAVSPAEPAAAIAGLAPVLDAMVAALEPGKFGEAHIELLACRIAGFSPGLVPALEKHYGTDFRASTDATGNGTNWKMETDGDYDVAAAYFVPDQLAKYAGELKGEGAMIGGLIGWGVDAMCCGATGGLGAAAGGYLGSQFDR